MIERIEKLADAIAKIDCKSPDYKIFLTEFNDKINDKNLLYELLGQHPAADLKWKEFKQQLISKHSEFGFTWVAVQGKAGPIELQSITLPAKVGEEIAQKLFEDIRSKAESKEKDQSMNFTDVVKRYLPKLTAYLSKTESNRVNLQLMEAKIQFAATQLRDNQKFKFATNSYRFILGVEKYTFSPKKNGKKKQMEISLGESIQEFLKTELKLEKIYHTQQKRRLKSYQNVDFEGYRVIPSLKGDDVEVISVELKPSNSIESISEAISQAVNYKERANRTYIAIPLFDPKSFYDTQRYYNFITLCRENELGILSIDIDSLSHKVNGVSIILEAQKRALNDYTTLLSLLEEDNREYCNMCHKVVEKTLERPQCTWRLERHDQIYCMKSLVEYNLKLPDAVPADINGSTTILLDIFEKP